jgi:arylsulfatase A-like enzyme
MNIILIMSDTFRRDAMGCYGPTQARTPRLDQFARESFIFDNAFLGSFPTIPNRLDIMSGQFSFIDHEWCRLPADTVTVQQVLSASGCTTMLIADNSHLIEDGYNYCRGFNGWEWIRGQESDLWYTSPKKVQLPSGGGKKNRGAKIRLPNIIRNSSWWQGEEDRHAPRTIKTACRWLELNQDHDRFFLWLDLFDPHEPWDAPKHYLELYEKEYFGEEIPYPRYDFWREFLSEEELKHCRALYLAEVSMVDHWVGVLMEKIEELGMSEDTAIIFTSDHGFFFGEQGLIGKSRIVDTEDGKQQIEAARLCHDIRSTPLLIRLPGQREAQHISALVQSPDLMPTILELAGLATTQVIDGEAKLQALQCGMFVTDQWQFRPESLHGRSLLPLLRRETKTHRDIAVSSFTLLHHTPVLAKSAIVTQDGMCLHYSGCYEESNIKAKMFIQAVMDRKDARIPYLPALYDLKRDPAEAFDILESNEALAREIHQRYVKWLEEHGTPEVHLSGRRRLH